MKENQCFAGILLNYLTETVKVLSVLLVTPVMLRLLGQQEYGLYQMVSSVVSGLSLLNFGFGSAYLRYYARYQAAQEESRFAGLNGLFFLLFSGLAILCLLCGLLMMRYTRQIFGDGLSCMELQKAQSLILVLTSSLAVTLFGGLFDCQILAQERFLFQKLLCLVQAVLNPLLTVPLLYLGYGSKAVVLVSLGLSVSVCLGNIFYCRYRIKMVISFRNLPVSELRELWGFAFFLFLNQIIDQVNWSVDKFLLGRMCGTGAVAVYGVGGQINTLYVQMSTAIAAVFAPKVNRIAAKTADNEALSRLMAKVGRGQMMILGLVLSGFLLFGREFLTLWAGRGYEQAYAVALLLMLPITIPLIQNLGLEILRTRNRHRVRSLVCSGLAICNLLLSIWLIPKFGAPGAAAGTAAALLAGNVLFMNWYYRNRLRLNMVHFWKEILPILRVAGGTLVIGVAVKCCFSISDWWQLIFVIGLYTLGYCAAMWCLVLNSREKQLLQSVIRKKNKGTGKACPPGVR